MKNAYDSVGYNTGDIGFGERPAVLVVDLQVAFTDPQFPAGKSADGGSCDRRDR